MAEALALSAVTGVLLARRDKIALLVAILAVAGVAWSYLALSAAHMSMDGAAHAAMGMSSVSWTAKIAMLTFTMWAVMMVAMMLPTAAPMVLTYAAVVGRVAPGQSKRSSVAVFATAYLLVWFGFSLAATLLQWGLERAAVLSSTTMALGPFLGGGLLIAAGVYQLSPLKEFCLRNCQSPLIFIASNWRSGLEGALRMGARHGAYCVGCCWVLMLLLFVGGVMNLLWVATISLFVLIEKLFTSRYVRRMSGAGLVIAGAILTVYGIN
jgi:predicted metal-binding membrane protein